MPTNPVAGEALNRHLLERHTGRLAGDHRKICYPIVVPSGLPKEARRPLVQPFLTVSGLTVSGRLLTLIGRIVYKDGMPNEPAHY